MLIPTEVQPRPTAVVRPEDPTRADRVVELAARVDDVGVVRIDLDHVVVGALLGAVVEDRVGTAPVRQDVPLAGRGGPLVDVRLHPVVPEAGVQRHRSRRARVRDRNREPRRLGRVVRVGKTGHERRPGEAAVGRAIDLVAPEAGVKDLRVLRVDLEISGAVFCGHLATQRPVDAAVSGLPDPEPRVDRRGDATGTAASAQHGRIEVARVRRVDDETRDRDAHEVVARDLVPRVPTVGRLEDAVARVAVTGQGAFTRPCINDVVVRRRDRECPDRERRQIVRLRDPGRCRRPEHPDSALGATEDPGSVLADREGADTAVHGRDDRRAPGDLADRRGSERRPTPAEGRGAGRGRLSRSFARLGG